MRRKRTKRKPFQKKQEPKHRINHLIKSSSVRLVEVDGESENDVINTQEALHRANDLEMDLVEISDKADPPVVKIMDYDKFLYQQKKKEKAQKQKQSSTEMKELRFGPNTDEHDLNFKLKHAERFLSDGNKLKVYIQFRGRSIVHKDRGRDLLERIKNHLSEISKVDSHPKMNGRRMIMMLAPK